MLPAPGARALGRFVHATFALHSTWTLATALALGVAAQAADDNPVERTDLLTFAQGAVPVSVGGDGARLGASFEHAVKLIDGTPAGFVVLNKGNDDTVTEFVYELPAATTFDRLAVPNVLETPSPSATFTRSVEIYGSSRSARDGYELLASATLSTHTRKGDVTELSLARTLPVRWVKVRLRGGIDLPRGDGALEFSEIIGHGTQDPAAYSDRFSGTWKQGANLMSLSQEGAVVAGCYDRSGDLNGTVSGNVLRATGIDRSDRTRSAFILSVTPEGSLRGVRSSNGAPFRLYTAPPAPPGTGCAAPAVAL
ncbi:MAG: hypothetical protein IT480_05920, partial [Gammaproteobacteria bacterium]|nr:hypothetical protein [Gammaproteobacteria bacterium]